jgi:hypothetical protein
MDPPVFEKLHFENDYTQADDIVLQPFTYDDLKCPDGESANFFAVYREGLTEAAPIVVVFHADAFDYVKRPNLDDPLSGTHYTSENRMTAEWAAHKVSETLGLLPGSAANDVELNYGTLPAALADAGTFALYPANCWGDMWHNEFGGTANDVSADGGVQRNGRFLAWYMTQIASTNAQSATDFREQFGLDDLAIPLDATGIYLVGLGEGGRAPEELLIRDKLIADNLPPVKGIIMDSPMDNLYAITGGTGFDDLKTGLQRIFPDTYAGDIGAYSMQRWITNYGLSPRLDLVWSSADPQVPDETLSQLVSLEGSHDAQMEVRDTTENGHIFINSEPIVARDAVGFMLGR